MSGLASILKFPSRAVKGVAALGGGGVVGAGLGAEFVTEEVGKPIYEALMGDPQGEAIKGAFRERAAIVEERLRQQRMMRLKMENVQRLASLRPDLYNQLVAGRPLPRDAVVVGGVPDNGMLDRVATMMAQGNLGDL